MVKRGENMTNNSRYRVQVVNNVQDDSMSVELIIDEKLCLELENVRGILTVQFYDPPKSTLGAKDFLTAFTTALSEAETLLLE
jgi:hypothetical protein